MLHDRLDKYLTEIETTLRQLENCHFEQYEEEVLTAKRVNLRIRIRFLTGQLVELHEAITLRQNKLNHLSYRYHFQNKENNLIFRYDNTPHFPDLETFPDHKHLPNKVETTEKPPLAQFIDEIVLYLSQG